MAGELNPDDDNSDVIVEFDNGERWIATFFTFKNINTLRERYKTIGECLSGTYFWAADMILIDQIDRNHIEQVIERLIKDKQFDIVFTKINKD